MSTKSLERKLERRVANAPFETQVQKIKQWYYQQQVELLAHDEEIELTSTQEEARLQYEQVFGMLVDGLPTNDIIAQIKTRFHVKDRQAYHILRDTKELYGDLHAIRKESMRVIQIELRKKMIVEIKNDPTLEGEAMYRLIHMYEERIEKIAGLDDPDTISFKDLVEALRLPDIEFSDDPTILDISHDDVEE